MARLTYLLRRGASYYFRIRVPLELVEVVGKTEIVKALGTKEESEAKRLMWPKVEEWHRYFEDLKARRTMTADDKADAVWQHYNAVIDRDEQARQSMPKQADVDEASRTVFERARRGEISSASPLAILDATIDVKVLEHAREHDAFLRRAKLDDMRKHLVSGETALIAHEADDYAERNRLLVDRTNPDWQDSARQMMRAEIEGLGRGFERDKGDYSGVPRDPIVKPATGTARETAAAGESIMELFGNYERENPKQIKPDTMAHPRRRTGTVVEDRKAVV